MNLSSIPHLVKEWHPTKNGELTPNDITHGSTKKVWWLCSKGHSFDSMPNSRTASKTGCPYCSGQSVSESNNLLGLFTEIAKEWHPTFNGELAPEQFTTGSSRKKVWWLCPKGHSYASVIGNRTKDNKPTGCPYCSGNKISDENNLQAVYPEIAKDWHPTKNDKLTPKQVTSKTNTKVWWLCPKGHSYDSKINGRTAKLTNCPYCSGRRVGEDNNLLYLFPEVAKEWHPTKNKELSPEQFVPGTHKKVWWLCPKHHSYEASIGNRTQKKPTSCPQCSNQSSEPEIRILSELKWFFEEVKHRYKLDGLEIDIFLPEFNIGIEYDGKYWHRNLTDVDLEKNQFMSSKGIHLVRVRQHPLKPLTENDVMVGYSLEKKDLDEILRRIAPNVGITIKAKINSYLAQPAFVNDELFKAYRSNFPSPLPENSLLETHPELSYEWDYEKNYPLKPENFSFGSHNKSWWLCSKGHSYDKTINHRTTNLQRKCPYCSGRKTLNLELFN